MKPTAAYCGLLCETCPIHVATRVEDRAEQLRMRVDIARRIRETYSSECAPEDITDCDGCTVEGGRLFDSCGHCAIRACARRNHFQNCAWCSAYACDQLETLFRSDADARIRLDAIRSALLRHGIG